MNFRSPKFLRLSLVPAVALLAQLGGCDRRPVTAEQSGAGSATSTTPSSTSNNSQSQIVGGKTTVGSGTGSK